MRATLGTSELLDCIATAATVTPRSSDRAGNTGVLMEVTQSRFSACGTDGDLSVISSAPASSTQPGSTLLPPRPILSYLNTLPKQGRSTITLLATDEVELSADGRTPYRFRPIVGSFTRPAGARIETRPVDLARLGTALKSVNHAASRDHGGIQLVSGPEGLALNATDNYRLAHALLVGEGYGNIDVVVPQGLLELAARLDVISIGVDAKRTLIRFASAKTSVTGKLLAVTFPPTEALLTASGTGAAIIPVRRLLDALRPLEAVAASRPLVAEIAGGVMTLTATNLEVGEGVENIPVERRAGEDDFRFGISATYLKDAVAALDAVGAETATFSWTTKDGALYLKADGQTPITLVVMPQTLD